MHNKIVGQFGEQLVQKYLLRNGYKIIGTNIKTSFKEIDIVAVKNSLLVFVEVKTRVMNADYLSEDAMTSAKTDNFRYSIELFLEQKNWENCEFRADLVCVNIDKVKMSAKISHYFDVI